MKWDAVRAKMFEVKIHAALCACAIDQCWKNIFEWGLSARFRVPFSCRRMLTRDSVAFHRKARSAQAMSSNQLG